LTTHRLTARLVGIAIALLMVHPAAHGQEAEEGPAKTDGSAIPAWVKKTTLSGDLRLRYAVDKRHRDIGGDDDRDRFRARVRLKAAFAFNEQLEIVSRLTTQNYVLGTAGDELSEGVVAYFDNFYGKWTPNRNLSLLAGMFDNQFYNSEMLWDPIYTNTGAMADLHAKRDNVQLRLKMAKIVFQERLWAGAAKDLGLFAVQGNVLWDAAERDNLKASLTYLDYSDAVRKVNFGQTTTNGNTGTNGLRRDDFDLLNPHLCYTRKLDAWSPVKLWAEYVHNAGAEHDRNGWQAGVSRGAMYKKKGDWQVLGYYQALEANSTLDRYTRWEFHGGLTNAKGFHAALGYTIAKDWMVQLRTYITDEVDGQDYDWQHYQIQTLARF